MTAFGDERLPTRFWEKVAEGQRVGGCWLWQGARGGGAGDYGVFYFQGKLRLAHRCSYHALVSPLDWSAPRGHALEHVHHTCRSGLCVNPAHLILTPASEHLGHGHRDKLSCPSGHPYDDSNTRIRSNGWRACRACDRARTRRQRRSAL